MKRLLLLMVLVAAPVLVHAADGGYEEPKPGEFTKEGCGCAQLQR